MASDPVDGKIWLLDAEGAVWSGTGEGGWIDHNGVPGTVGTAVSTEIAAANGVAYVRGPDKALWMRSPPWGRWRMRLVTRAG